MNSWNFYRLQRVTENSATDLNFLLKVNITNSISIRQTKSKRERTDAWSMHYHDYWIDESELLTAFLHGADPVQLFSFISWSFWKNQQNGQNMIDESPFGVGVPPCGKSGICHWLGIDVLKVQLTTHPHVSMFALAMATVLLCAVVCLLSRSRSFVEVRQWYNDVIVQPSGTNA